tara:strand:- start:24828 stop:28379 length:3552 start_codon:yes stop_codon:yes gene_type:complete
MYKKYLKTYQDQGEVKLTFEEWCTQNGGGLCESDLTKAQEAYEQYTNDFDISSVQFNNSDSNSNINSVKFNNTIDAEEKMFNAPNQIIGQNFRMNNPYLLSSIGDNPFLDLVGAVGESIQYWKDNDLSKQKPPYPIDPTGKFLINAELQEKYPNRPTKFMQTPDEYDEWLIQRELDYRAEMYPDLYQKEKVDLEDYRKTGNRNFKNPNQTMKLGDRLETREYPDAEYINYDESGNPFSYYKTVDDELQEFPIFTGPIETESIPLDPDFRFETNNNFELQPQAPYDMASFYGPPAFDIVAEDAGIESDFSTIDDELIEERFGGSLPKAQSKGEIDLNLLNIGDCTGGGCRDTGDTSTGISLFTGVEGSNQENALIQAGLKGGVTSRNSSNIGFSLTGEAGFQNNLKDLLTSNPNPSAFHSGKLNVGYKNRPLYVGNQQYPGDNIGVYGEYDSNYGINTGLEGGFGPLNIQAGYNFNSQSPYIGGSLKFNLRNGGGLTRYQDGEEFDADADPFDFVTDEGTYDEDMYTLGFDEDIALDIEEDQSDNTEYYNPEDDMEEEDDDDGAGYYSDNVDLDTYDPYENMYDGSTPGVTTAPSDGGGNTIQTVSTDPDEEFQTMTSGDKRAINKANNTSFGEKVLNTWDKIGTTAVNIAKPITGYLQDRQARKTARRMQMGYLSDNVFMPTDADLSGSKGDYDPNTGIFRPDDKVISRLGRYGIELPKAEEGNEFIANRYPGFDDLTSDEQNQVLSQYRGSNNSSGTVNTNTGYSDQYNETMNYKTDNRTVGYNPAIADLPNWMTTPNEGYDRVIIDDEMKRYMQGQLAGGNLSPNVAEGYNRFLSGYRGIPSAIDYNKSDYDRYQTFDDEKKSKFSHFGSGFGYQSELPGKGTWNTVSGHYDADTMESLINLANNRVNTSRYPDLDQDAIDADNNRDFNRMISREAYKIKKNEKAEADEYFKNWKLKHIEEDPEEEEEISLYDFTYPGGTLDEVTLTDERPPIQGGMLDEVVLTDTAPSSTTLQPRQVTSVTSSNTPTIEPRPIQTSIDEIDTLNNVNSNQSTVSLPVRNITTVTPNNPSNTIPVIEANNQRLQNNQDTTSSETTGYTPQSVERKEYTPQSADTSSNEQANSQDDYTPQSVEREEYTPQSQEEDIEEALYGGSFYGTGGEAEIDINMYKALIAAGADLEIL